MWHVQQMFDKDKHVQQFAWIPHGLDTKGNIPLEMDNTMK